MFMNLPLVSLSMLDILEINVATVISPVLHINFDKIHIDSEVVISMTLLLHSFENNCHLRFLHTLWTPHFWVLCVSH